MSKLLVHSQGLYSFLWHWGFEGGCLHGLEIRNGTLKSFNFHYSFMGIKLAYVKKPYRETKSTSKHLLTFFLVGPLATLKI